MSTPTVRELTAFIGDGPEFETPSGVARRLRDAGYVLPFTSTADGSNAVVTEVLEQTTNGEAATALVMLGLVQS